MRDYALTYASTREAAGAASWFSRLIRNFMARRAVAALERYDDYILRDIGITRDEVRWAAQLPLSQNAALALEEEALRRRRATSLRR